MSPKRILLLDNYDSFTYNLYQFLLVLGADVTVARNDEITVEEIRAGDYDGIVMDSNPTAEYEETRDKAKALLTALELAQQGL